MGKKRKEGGKKGDEAGREVQVPEENIIEAEVEETAS